MKGKFMYLSLVVSLYVSVFFSNSSFADQPIDDCTPIRSQIAALPVAGGEVTIAEGKYFCSSPIVIDHDNIWLRGEGHVELALTDMANSPVILMGDVRTPPSNISNIKVSDLSIDGNKANQSEECWGGECDEGGTTYIRNNGISVRAVTNGEITNVIIKDGRSGGVVTERGCYHFHVSNLTVTGSQFDGFAGYQTYDSIFEGMNLYRNKAAGISIDIDFSTNTIRNTTLAGNGDVGIFMRDSRFNLFENIVVNENGSHGVFVAQADVNDPSTCATDNEFRDLSVYFSQGAGLQLNDPCLRNKLTGHSRFQGNQEGCIGAVNKKYVFLAGSLTCN